MIRWNLYEPCLAPGLMEMIMIQPLSPSLGPPWIGTWTMLGLEGVKVKHGNVMWVKRDKEDKRYESRERQGRRRYVSKERQGGLELEKRVWGAKTNEAFQRLTIHIDNQGYHNERIQRVKSKTSNQEKCRIESWTVVAEQRSWPRPPKWYPKRR